MRTNFARGITAHRFSIGMLKTPTTDTICWCPRCNSVVDAEDWLDTDTGTHEWYCMRCGSDEVDEAGKCSMCGKPIPPYEWATNQYAVCEDCLDNVDIVIKSATETLRGGTKLTFSEAKALIAERICEEEE